MQMETMLASLQAAFAFQNLLTLKLTTQCKQTTAQLLSAALNAKLLASELWQHELRTHARSARQACVQIF
jgi:hypothetical protein